MKKLVFGLIATVVFGFVGNAQEIEQSTAIITKGRVTKEGEEEKSARSFALLNFNISNKLETEYYVDGHLYNDSGEKNDLKSGDGIYTSVDYL